ncbi:MAG: hypothetical protein IKD68_03390 [Solobacterium sp.]|nr:hypothetical protein [Solobacterium sp.]
MSLIIHMKVPGALILASDCRVIGSQKSKSGSYSYIVSDAEQKTFPVHPRLAFSYSGDADLHGVPVSFLLKRAMPSLNKAESTEEAASLLLDLFCRDGKNRHPSFLISGYNGSTPSVLDLPAGKTEWKEQYPLADVYGVTTMGDNAIAQSLIEQGTYDFHLFRIPDAVNFARFLIETTAGAQSFQKTRQTVSTNCDILVMSEEKAHWVMRSSDPYCL